MSEQYHRPDQSADEREFCVEREGFMGRALARRVGHDALKWEVSVRTQNGRLLCYLDDLEVDNAEGARRFIDEVINQFLWDPMSQG